MADLQKQFSSKMMKQNGVDPARLAIIKQRYEKFLSVTSIVDSEPIKVFDPLSKKALEELELIRSVSKNLQEKKEEDVKKAAQAAAELAESAKEAEQKVEETKEN